MTFRTRQTALLTVYSLLLALVLGLGSAWLVLDGDPPFGRRRLGPWLTWPKLGSPEADPYMRAIVARRGDVPLAVGEGLSFLADKDSGGRRLDSACSYRVGSVTPQARFWSMTIHPPGNVAASEVAAMSQLGRSGFTSAEIVRRPDDGFDIFLSKDLTAGNWLQLPTGGRSRSSWRSTILPAPPASISMPTNCRRSSAWNAAHDDQEALPFCHRRGHRPGRSSAYLRCSGGPPLRGTRCHRPRAANDESENATLISSPGGEPTWLPLPDPALAIAACAFNLEDGPARITAHPGQSFLSLSLHSKTSGVFFAVTDRAAIRGELELVVMTQRQLDEARAEEDENEPSRDVRIVAPSEQGFAIIRVAASIPSLRPAAIAVAKEVSCTVDGDEEEGE